MWQLQTDNKDKRTYTNPVTGGKCTTSKVYTDKEGNHWYQFDNLMTLPHTRKFAANKISSLYTLGLSKDDLNSHVSGLKSILKSNDPERYEKAYANVLDFESKAANATDAVKQMSSLVCVYFLINDEVIDSWDNDLQLRKMAILESDPDAHAFFLNLQMNLTEDYIQHSSLISQIVSQAPKELSVLSD